MVSLARMFPVLPFLLTDFYVYMQWAIPEKNTNRGVEDITFLKKPLEILG